MQSPWELMEVARALQAERLSAAERGRLRSLATPGELRTPLRLRTAALLRQVADVLEDRSVRTA